MELFCSLSDLTYLECKLTREGSMFVLFASRIAQCLENPGYLGLCKCLLDDLE